jgi:hypothetical protein
MNYQALVAQFEAKGGKITRCEEGARTLTGKDIARAIGYERDSMVKFLVYGFAETGEEFCDTIFAYDMEDALARHRQRYPEAQITGARESIRGQT